MEQLLGEEENGVQYGRSNSINWKNSISKERTGSN